MCPPQKRSMITRYVVMAAVVSATAAPMLLAGARLLRADGHAAPALAESVMEPLPAAVTFLAHGITFQAARPDAIARGGTAKSARVADGVITLDAPCVELAGLDLSGAVATVCARRAEVEWRTGEVVGHDVVATLGGPERLHLVADTLTVPAGDGPVALCGNLVVSRPGSHLRAMRALCPRPATGGPPEVATTLYDVVGTEAVSKPD